MRLLSLAALTSAIAVAATGPVAAKKVAVPDRYDGSWSIEVITEDGPCDRAYRYGVKIDRGQASYAGDDFDVRGRVSGNGSVKAVIARGSDSASVVGRLGREGLGNGTWTTNGPVRCTGRWNAERRG
ncbi:large exoprotein involved in heme utilization or adhesion [Methylobacterium sp. Leaf399]|uniref:hypothetical protein n=1 Tax=unclassified Methylobacterium TaxID=2615210 RepID=UPI0006F5307B|nr:large exoprotein involved in heme utilization or adhesion [Methylobacterium sp. Leaf108]KQT09246.1 large exoprotein involved in heme utilization or adhesion [Methylobacterium sp. Leaf399]KQT79047.1 large exoprotein involved in heme utilization or adhesion [Methylobacterium sp. Leaf466]